MLFLVHILKQNNRNMHGNEKLDEKHKSRSVSSKWYAKAQDYSFESN